MRPPVELHRPTILNIAAIVCYCFAMLFHLIAFATDNWSTAMINGVQWRLGLWHGCRQNGPDSEWQCSTDVFNDRVFQSGKSSDWHVGSQVMMTIALIILFVLEFAIIAYACIKNVEKYKNKLVALTIALSVSAGSTILVTIILVGSEAPKQTGSALGWSFGMCFISFVFVIILLFILAFESFRATLILKDEKLSTHSEEGSVISDELDSRVSHTNTVVDLNLEEDAF